MKIASNGNASTTMPAADLSLGASAMHGSCGSASDVNGIAVRGQIVTETRLSRFPWPVSDPCEVVQAQRRISGADRDLLHGIACHGPLNEENLLASTRGRAQSEALLWLINHTQFRFNWRNKTKIGRSEVENACAGGRPLEIVIPSFCVIPNPVKRLDPLGPTAAEDVSLMHLARLDQLARLIYPPGVTVHIISDSHFYSPAYGVTSVEAGHYLLGIRNRVVHLGLAHCLDVRDLSELLVPRMPEFQSAYYKWYRAYKINPLADGTDRCVFDNWVESTRCNINSQRLGLSYTELREAFGPDANLSSPVRIQLDGEAREALTVYRAVKAAASELRWEAEFFPDAIRATIHTKDIPVLGLRLYPEYKVTSRLLPYHGVGLVWHDPKWERYRLSVCPELFLRGRNDLVKVVDDGGRTSFYMDADAQ